MRRASSAFFHLSPVALAAGGRDALDGEPAVRPGIVGVIAAARRADHQRVEATTELKEAVDAAFLRVCVLDRGPGLPDDRLARAGYDFVSTKGETRGLGLALARAGIERLGGTLTVSRRDGGGLSATLQWPRLPSPS